MKYGIAHKNLTDGILVFAAIMALVCVLLSFLAFEEGMTIEDPKTGEDVEIDSPFDDPAVKMNLQLFATFALTAFVGFAARKWLLISLAASVGSLVVAFNCFADGTLGYMCFAYVFFAIMGLVGNLIHMVFVKQEEKEQFKEMVNEKRKEKLIAKGLFRKKQ